MARWMVTVVAVVLTLACGGTAQANDFSGTYVFNGPGGSIILMLEQDDDGEDPTDEGGVSHFADRLLDEMRLVEENRQ